MKDARLEDTPTHRLIASSYPTKSPFDYMPDAEAAAVAMVLEGASNERLTDVTGRLARIPDADRVSGVPTAHQAMAAFLHVAPAGGRFNDGTLGAWYAALDVDTAIDETLYHHTRRFQASTAGFPRGGLVMRDLVSRPAADLVDVRGVNDAALYDPADYTAGQQLAARLRREGRDGLWYESVRRHGGENVVIFKPRLVVPITQGDHYRYTWRDDGIPSVDRITNVR